jgi:hypothetical protein
MTRSELRARVLTLLNESSSAPVFYSAAELNQVLDEAAEVVVEESQAIKRTVFVSLLDGTAYYSLRALGATLMAPWRIWAQGTGRRLTAVTMAQLDAEHATWPTVTGSPTAWFPVSWDLFGIFPRPAAGGGVLRIDALAWPRALAQDDDEPELLDGDHEALVLYGAYDGAAKRWDAAIMLQAWSLFRGRWDKARARAGAAGLQARTFQVGEAETGGFTSGIALGDG